MTHLYCRLCDHEFKIGEMTILHVMTKHPGAIDCLKVTRDFIESIYICFIKEIE